MGIDRKKYFRHSKAVTRSKRWPALRQQILRRDDYKCVQCGARGKLEIDHKVPVRLDPARSFDSSNLQALCKTCHSRKTAHEVNGTPPNPQRKEWRELILSMR